MTREQWDELFLEVDTMPLDELEKIMAETARKAGVLQTNADRIRSMSDEELATLLINWCAGVECKSSNCRDCAREWLKEEVDNGT